ncbi:hypothetical protein AAFF_G00024490 [Aldrovandia affinis]|uniref:Integrase catalytic domain-containing protein n=1 Tax=Aldrovandia affinis TaxID=143900 RepID=A0AAD7WZ03_9TELE|nr:hypothetical protein AAFF_G00024490 [Aldrovandia affinis]
MCGAMSGTVPGANFQSELIAELLELAGVGQSRTSPYHPMGNGGTERFNRTLGGMLRSLPPRSKHKWPQMIQTMTFTYNCTQHETTGFAPFYLMFGRVPRLPVDLLFRNVLRDDCVCDYNAYVKSLATDLQSAMLLAQRHSSVEQKHQSDQYNKKVKGLPLSVGDRVLVANKSGRGKRKLADRWEPAVYTVVASKPQFHIYKIRDRDGQVRTVHRNLLLAVNFLPLDNTLFAEDDLRSVDTVSHDPSNVPDPEAAVSEPESVAEHSVVDSSSWLNVSERNRTASWVCDQSCTAEVESVNDVSVGRASSPTVSVPSTDATALPSPPPVPLSHALPLTGILPQGPENSVRSRFESHKVLMPGRRAAKVMTPALQWQSQTRSGRPQEMGRSQAQDIGDEQQVRTEQGQVEMSWAVVQDSSSGYR